MMFKVFLILLAALSFQAQLKAEITFGSSLEWLADTSVSIGIYRTDAIVGKKPGAAKHVSCSIGNTLKGTPPKTATFEFLPNKRDALGYSIPAAHTLEDRFLICFRNDQSGQPTPIHYINLSQPLTGGSEGLAINHKFEVLTDEGTIIRIVKDRVKSHPSAKVLPLNENPGMTLNPITKKPALDPTRVPIPSSATAHPQLYAGSTCYLLIPIDLLPKP